MTFQVELTQIAETQIEQSYQWYRERNPEFADRLALIIINTDSLIDVVQGDNQRFSWAGALIGRSPLPKLRKIKQLSLSAFWNQDAG
jgi:hypothetical protein